jgi:hypothetical protein
VIGVRSSDGNSMEAKTIVAGKVGQAAPRGPAKPIAAPQTPQA